MSLIHFKDKNMNKEHLSFIPWFLDFCFFNLSPPKKNLKKSQDTFRWQFRYLASESLQWFAQQTTASHGGICTWDHLITNFMLCSTCNDILSILEKVGTLQMFTLSSSYWTGDKWSTKSLECPLLYSIIIIVFRNVCIWITGWMEVQSPDVKCQS